jgi:L-amino acid N-acyltransferase YncA
MRTIRMANANDCGSMREIYSPYVEESPVSFETETPSLAEFEKRLLEREGKYPWLVCESENEILGYAYAGPFHTRCAYQWSVESSIYIKRGHQGAGIGRSLYEQLFAILKRQGVVNVIGGMTLPNEASRKLHESFGFVQVAQYRDIGFKLGRWWDVGYWQLQLAKPDRPETPRPPSY